MDIIIAKYNYFIFVILLMIGLWAMMAKNNLVKKIIGMSIFQTAVILFYISIGTKEGSTIPILEHGHEIAGHVENVIHAADYANPLTQILMLTAIDVGVSTLGVALGLIQKIYKEYGTIEEDEILEQIK